MDSESKLIPILREGVEIVKVIFFMDLRDHLRVSQAGWDHDFSSKVTAAVVGDVFGGDHQEGALADFVAAHRQVVDEVRAKVGCELPALRILLTDALRTMVLCDYQEDGRDTSLVLERAREWGILLSERELPLPNSFIDLVRRLGTAKGILQAVQPI
ncbi:MAG: hypothetical protein Q8J76_02055 [Desulfobulbaceae bacterium]|nr:hypothetical protein [Desulfobulbaceae bacterium]